MLFLIAFALSFFALLGNQVSYFLWIEICQHLTTAICVFFWFAFWSLFQLYFVYSPTKTHFQVPFRGFGSSLLKSAVMMIGEFEFDTTFNTMHEAGGRTESSVVWFEAVTIIQFVLFLVIMTILIMNLLVSLKFTWSEGATCSQVKMQRKIQLYR